MQLNEQRSMVRKLCLNFYFYRCVSVARRARTEELPEEGSQVLSEEDRGLALQIPEVEEVERINECVNVIGTRHRPFSSVGMHSYKLSTLNGLGYPEYVAISYFHRYNNTLDFLVVILPNNNIFCTVL